MASDFYETLIARPMLYAPTAAALRAEPSAKYVQGQQTFVSATGAQLFWDAASLAVDNGNTIVKPTDILPANPGRFLAIPGGNAGRITLTYFVDGGSVEPTENGSIETPYKTIQAAIDATTLIVGAVWQILVAPGGYAETLTVPADREIVIQPLIEAGIPAASNPVVLTGGGDVNWNPAGAVVATSLSLRGMQFDDLIIDNVPAAAVAARLEIEGSTATGSIDDSGGAPFTGSIQLDTVLGSTLTATSATVRTRHCAFAFAVNVGALIDEASTFASFLTVNVAGVAAVLSGTTVTGPLASVVGEIWMDGQAARLSAALGGLPTPASGAANLWRGEAAYYSLQHTVRRETVNFAANLGDEYLAVLPPAATTVTVTLPAAAIFAASVSETNGGILRWPTRHLIVRNEALPGTVAIVAFATLGTDTIDGVAASGFALFPGESVRLVPVLFGAVWSWQPEDRYGRNYMSVTSAGVSSSVVAAYATKVSLVTPPLRGVYRVIWRAVVSADNANTDIQTRLNNATDAVQIGSINRTDVDSTAERVAHGGGGLVTFAGAAKTFDLEWQRPVGGGNANIEDAWIEVWRVA